MERRYIDIMQELDVKSGQYVNWPWFGKATVHDYPVEFGHRAYPVGLHRHFAYEIRVTADCIEPHWLVPEGEST